MLYRPYYLFPLGKVAYVRRLWPVISAALVEDILAGPMKAAAEIGRTLQAKKEEVFIAEMIGGKKSAK